MTDSLLGSTWWRNKRQQVTDSQTEISKCMQPAKIEVSHVNWIPWRTEQIYTAQAKLKDFQLQQDETTTAYTTKTDNKPCTTFAYRDLWTVCKMQYVGGGLGEDDRPSMSSDIRLAQSNRDRAYFQVNCSGKMFYQNVLTCLFSKISQFFK